MQSDTINNSKPIIIITGLSGSGKSTALSVFEDMGFYKIDGLPSSLLRNFVKALNELQFSGYKGLVLGLDFRQPESIEAFTASLSQLKKSGFTTYTLFFEAKTDVLVHRYASTRRPHPLEKEGLGLAQAMEEEEGRLQPIRYEADLVLDTSDYSAHTLRRVLQKKWKEIRELDASHLNCHNLRVHLISFGFKYGTPAEADWVFDLRFLPNPFFVPELKELSGLDAPVSDYVLESASGKDFLCKLFDFTGFILEQNEREGRYRITLGIGCTGGHHRSVAVLEALALHLRQEKYNLTIEHRHLGLG